MNIKNLVAATLTASSLGLASSVFSPVQAATFGGSSLCETSSFSYLNCAGAFSGNDKGAQGSGTSNLNSFFGEGWSFVGDDEDGTVSVSGGEKSGTASTSLSGFGAIAIKAGNSYSLYTVEDLAEFTWDTLGVTPVGKKGNNAPGLSHLSIYQRAMDAEKSTEEVPEPSIFLGLVMVVGAGARLRNKLDSAS